MSPELRFGAGLEAGQRPLRQQGARHQFQNLKILLTHELFRTYLESCKLQTFCNELSVAWQPSALLGQQLAGQPVSQAPNSAVKARTSGTLALCESQMSFGLAK